MSKRTTDASDSPLEEVQIQVEQFKAEALQFWNRAEKYDDKEFMQQLQRTGLSLLILGAVGYGAKIVCLPIVQFLVGA